MVLKSLAQLLATRGHEVRPFLDGREALGHIAAKSDVDVLITSTEPESMSGVELVWEARLLANSGRPLHIVLMSSNCDENQLIQALDCGADDFIGKPPAAQELYARLRSAERMLSMQRELIRLAATDPLTGALNRRAFFERAQIITERAASCAPLSAIMFDIDHFKGINDEYGHAAGDQALRAVADEVVRRHAMIGRLGGEEFAILLEGVEHAAAIEAAEQLRAVVATLRLKIENRTITLTCSFGVAEWNDGDGIDGFLKRADHALYEAKRGGRNRVVGSRRAPLPDDDANRRSVVRAFGRA